MNKNIATLNGSCDVPMVVNGVEEKENGGKKKKKKKKKKTQDDDEPVAKKVKKEKEEMKVKEEKWEPEQKGVFRKIFYRPTESTINMPDEEVTEFRTENHMNITGRLAELFKPVRSFDDYCN